LAPPSGTHVVDPVAVDDRPAPHLIDPKAAAHLHYDSAQFAVDQLDLTA